MNHTKGPWTIFNGYIVQANEENKVPLNSKWIAQIEYFGPDNTAKNAQLIAAAPELLQALKDILEMFKSADFSCDNCGKPFDMTTTDCALIAQKAINKAESE